MQSTVLGLNPAHPANRHVSHSTQLAPDGPAHWPQLPAQGVQLGARSATPLPQTPAPPSAMMLATLPGVRFGITGSDAPLFNGPEFAALLQQPINDLKHVTSAIRAIGLSDKKREKKLIDAAEEKILTRFIRDMREGPEISSLIRDSLAIALHSHFGQQRPGPFPWPYNVHLLGTAQLVSRYTSNPRLISVALLHDLVEDKAGTLTVQLLQMIMDKYHPSVGQMVVGCSDNQVEEPDFPDPPDNEQPDSKRIRKAYEFYAKRCKIVEHLAELAGYDANFDPLTYPAVVELVQATPHNKMGYGEMAFPDETAVKAFLREPEPSHILTRAYREDLSVGQGVLLIKAADKLDNLSWLQYELEYYDQHREDKPKQQAIDEFFNSFSRGKLGYFWNHAKPLELMMKTQGITLDDQGKMPSDHPPVHALYQLLYDVLHHTMDEVGVTWQEVINWHPPKPSYFPDTL